jgi:hypothetical protein
MRDLVMPMEMVWTWAGSTFGMPGQMLLLCAGLIGSLTLFVWFGNKQGAAGCR